MDRNRDLFSQLSIDLIQIILSFLITQKKKRNPNFNGRFLDTKQAVQTIILSKRFLEAWYTFPHLNFTDIAFNESLLRVPGRANQFQRASVSMEAVLMERRRFANYVLETVTRYQQHKIPITSLRLTAHVEDDKIADILHHSITKAKESGVKEICLLMVKIHPSFVQTVFALKQLTSLTLYNCELVNKGGVDIFVNCSSLRVLKFDRGTIDEYMLQKLIHSCGLIEKIKIDSCKGIETIQIAQLPYLKSLKVFTVRNQRVYVKSESLELVKYGYNPFLNIKSAQNLKILKLLQCSHITDEQFHNLLPNCPVLEQLTILNCHDLQKIKISSKSLSFLSIIICRRLTEVKIDAPTLNRIEYFGLGVRLSFIFANGDSGKIKFDVTLDLDDLGEASSFLELRKFLATLKQLDNVTLDFSSEEVSFDRYLMDEKSIPEFEEVNIRVSSPSSTYSTIMEGLLWCFSPKIISLKNVSWEYKEFIMHICNELLVQHDHDDDDRSNISITNAFISWGNYFKQAKFKDRDDNWRPLHCWKSLADALENLGDEYILKLSHN